MCAALVVALAAAAASAQAVQLPDFTELVERTGPAVVNIRTTARVSVAQGVPQLPDLEEGDPMLEFFRRFFPQPGPVPRPGPRGPREREVPRGLGSGFVISSDGYVLTNHHVVDGADEILVTLTDRREFKGKLIGSDRRTDVALVKIDASGLPTVKIGDPNKVKVGEWVIAIGSPFGLDNTVTAGIVSAKGRETGEYLPFIQTDVAVNPGNSGGPLINMRGEVIGINSQIFTTSGAYAGISFAIPIDEAMNVAEQLRTVGRVIRGRIGVAIGDVSKDVAEAIGLGRPRGALVSTVERDSPAEKAGVEPGDVILRFAGRDIERSSDLPRIVGGTKPGTRVAMQVFRKGKTVDLQVTVAELPADRPVARRGADTPRAGAANSLGLVVSDVPPERLKELRLRGGVQVDSVDGAAARVGVRPGDLILAINNVEVTSAKQFNDLVAKLDPKNRVLLLVRRGDQTTFLVIRPSDR
ncbi:MAG TPA: DegQ family serine endoprotease [Burkholderiaceae bacterium]|jgi:serine protease Do|nr:DegQ family serine endoprotease [Burkholderiaceae bacterium]